MSRIIFRKSLGALSLLLALSLTSGTTSAETPTTQRIEKQKRAKKPVGTSSSKALISSKGKGTSAGVKVKPLTVSEVWFLGPFPLHRPALNKKFPTKNFLKKKLFAVEKFSPPSGTYSWLDGENRKWRKKALSQLSLETAAPSSVGYAAFYVETDRFRKIQLQISSNFPWKLFLDGKFKGRNFRCASERRKKLSTRLHPNSSPPPTKTDLTTPHGRLVAPIDGPGHIDIFESYHLITAGDEPSEVPPPNGDDEEERDYLKAQLKLLSRQIEMLNRQLSIFGLQIKRKSRKNIKTKRNNSKTLHLSLTPGVHLFVLKGLFSPKCFGKKWSLNISIKPTQPKTLAGLNYSLFPRKIFSTSFLLNRVKLKGASISPDGGEVVLWYTKTDKSGKTSSWYELRDFSGKVLYSAKPSGRLANFQWSPDGRYYSFLTRKRKGKKFFGTLWVVERKSFKVRAAAENIQGLSYHKWSPDSRVILLAITEKLKSTKVERSGLKRLRGMPDRWPWFRNRTKLYALFLRGGGVVQLTDDRWSAENPHFSPDGRKLLFLRWRPDYRKRPFFFADIFELDLKSFALKPVLRDLAWLRDASYSPDGKKLLLVGGPSLFGKLGWSEKLPKGSVPNEYDRQLYVYDLSKREVELLTKGFAPAVSRSYWNPVDGNIYFTAVDRSYFRLYRYNVSTGKIERIPTQAETVFSFHFARHKPRAVLIGTGVTHPVWAYTLELKGFKQRLLAAPARAELSELHLSKVEPWRAKLPGKTLDGRIYYPPGFDPRKKYPLIVYYYGGTYPVIRTFDGRYPFHLWAAHGYVVYVLQPSGAIGFGQVHSARHVNEWGSVVADEIIAAVKQFLAAHDFVDPKRVGSIGASYGGFMTMYLQTRTKLFSAAISHAGISNITSYWGAGFWGYLYSAVATAHRYPWSHPNFYIRQSPLYSAHKITTPLLLLHGSADTNVPPAESIQMYTALKLLNRPVELILVKGENHWILSYKKRLLWTQTILAWFDRYLKGQPLWWKSLYPDK